ncbi:DUF1385 domain-containing protein [Phosphitispora fastidiosa]|uniref:DUF1385 domain-containing protein n=1 Tax=Phosphitispora fastidiosa TaxID=2837202 RepID=UPI002F418F26|nr:putative protein YqhQ [Phosphitispora fastidiosa]
MSDKVTYGGQAVIEGVMMRGRDNVAIAVRKPDNEIIVEERPVNSITKKLPFLKLPFLRGTVSLFESLIIGIQALTFSASQAAADEEEQLSPWEMTLTIGVAVILGILLFIVTPTSAARLLYSLESVVLINFLEGLLRIGIFLVYVLAISRMKDIQRVFQYHGAEHKVISTFEANEKLTVANARKYSQLHPRCGTSFLLIVMVIMVFVFSFLGKQDLVMRIASRIALLPVVAGISFEILKLSGKYCNSPLMKVLITPGLWLQKLTTREPDDSQLEVAIASLKSVLAKEEVSSEELSPEELQEALQ